MRKMKYFHSVLWFIWVNLEKLMQSKIMVEYFQQIVFSHHLGQAHTKT